MKNQAYLFLLFSLLAISCSKPEPATTSTTTKPNTQDTVKYKITDGYLSVMRSSTINNNDTTNVDCAIARFHTEIGDDFVGPVYCNGKIMIGYAGGQYPSYHSDCFSEIPYLANSTIWKLIGNNNILPVSFSDPSSFPELTSPIPDTIIRSQGLNLSFTNADSSKTVVKLIASDNYHVFIEKSGPNNSISFSEAELSSVPVSARIFIQFQSPTIDKYELHFHKSMEIYKTVNLIP